MPPRRLRPAGAADAQRGSRNFVPGGQVPRAGSANAVCRSWVLQSVEDAGCSGTASSVRVVDLQLACRRPLLRHADKPRLAALPPGGDGAHELEPRARGLRPQDGTQSRHRPHGQCGPRRNAREKGRLLGCTRLRRRGCRSRGPWRAHTAYTSPAHSVTPGGGDAEGADGAAQRTVGPDSKGADLNVAADSEDVGRPRQRRPGRKKGRGRHRARREPQQHDRPVPHENG